MFIKSVTDKRRVIIVDFNHMAWAYAFSRATSLSCTYKNLDGTLSVINTTVPAYTIKALNRWANCGSNPLAVCFDCGSSAKSRKAYFAKLNGVSAEGKAQGYKAKREVKDRTFYESIDTTFDLLYRGGVACYKAECFEADDLIKACVDNAKRTYPDLPIDIITGDADLVPLVDDQVSVFLRSKQSTYAESKEYEKLHYVQLTPNNYQGYLEGLNAYKNLRIPYNSLLLAKLLRGDKSDEIMGKADWKPRIYNQLIQLLEDDGQDMGELFRYDAPTETFIYKGTQTKIPTELIATTPRDQLDVIYGEPPALTRLCEVLGKFCEPDDLVHVRNIYNGINLNGAFMDLPAMFCRRPAKITTPIKGYSAGQLQAVVSKLNIRLGI